MLGLTLELLYFGNILDFIIKTTTTMVGEKITYNIRNKLYKYIEYANISFHDKTPSGTLFVRITSDVEDITTAFKDVVTTFIKDVLIIIALAIMMLLLNYKLSLICFTIIPLVILTSAIITKISQKVHEVSKIAKTKLNIICFGPFLSLGIAAGFLWGGDIINGYLSLIR